MKNLTINNAENVRSKMLKKTAFLLCFIFIGVAPNFAQSIKLPGDGQKILDTRFRSWKLAEMSDEIIKYFQQRRSFEEPNLIKGDWNGDGFQDYAVLLQNKKDESEKIIVALIKTRKSYKDFVFGGDDCLMSVKKGTEDYNFEAKKTFRNKNDAIFSYIWEKAGTTYIWEKGKFRAIITSD